MKKEGRIPVKHKSANNYVGWPNNNLIYKAPVCQGASVLLADSSSCVHELGANVCRNKEVLSSQLQHGPAGLFQAQAQPVNNSIVCLALETAKAVCNKAAGPFCSLNSLFNIQKETCGPLCMQCEPVSCT